MTRPLAGRVALVTGAGRGLGRVIALALAEAGADVAVSSRTTSEIERTAAEVEGLGPRSLAVVCDVTDPEQIARLVQRVEGELAQIDILVNNAGASGSHKFIDHPDDLWDRMLAVNLTSVYRVSKAVAPRMIERGWGRIINIASVSGKVAYRYTTAYTASKHGVLGLTRVMALELNPHNITVNAICPGYVDTPMTEANITQSAERTGRTPEEVRAIVEGTNPQGRMIAPEEVAAVAVMLAGEAARGITSQAINVDGGEVLF